VQSFRSRIIPAEDSYPVFDETGRMIAFIEFYNILAESPRL